MPRGLIFVLLMLFIDTVGFGIIIPATPSLIVLLTGEGLSAAARYGGWLLFTYAAVQFFAAPVIGNLSDRFGRRPVLLVSMLAFGLDYLVMGLSRSLLWLFCGRALAGFCGATFPTANAYVADITPKEQRAKYFGLLGAAWGTGFIVGPALGGLLATLGPRVPFFVAAGLAVANVAYGSFALRESLPHEARRPFSFRRANPIGGLLELRRFPVVVGLIGALLFYQIAHDANPSTWTYYAMEKFHWSEFEVGLSMAFVGLTFAIVQAGLIGAIVARLGERRTVHIGLTLYVLGFMGLAFATRGWMVYACIIPFAFGTIANPSIKSIMSRAVPANMQGALQGALSSMMSLTAIVAPVMMTQLFSYFTGAAAPVYFPGVPFFTAGILTAVALVVATLVLRYAASREPA
jgi:DHA1 family tetracycline resistance protein-like MFS transporter